MSFSADLGDLIIWTFWFMFLVAWISLFIACMIDIFRDHELGGGGKAGWTILLIVLPFIGCLIYMFARGDSMNRRAAKRRRESEQELRAHVQDAASTSSTSEELSKLAELRQSGVITDQDYEQAKAKMLA
jgi:hypothetical protein